MHVLQTFTKAPQPKRDFEKGDLYAFWSMVKFIRLNKLWLFLFDKPPRAGVDFLPLCPPTNVNIKIEKTPDFEARELLQGINWHVGSGNFNSNAISCLLDDTEGHRVEGEG